MTSRLGSPPHKPGLGPEVTRESVAGPRWLQPIHLSGPSVELYLLLSSKGSRSSWKAQRSNFSSEYWRVPRMVRSMSSSSSTPQPAVVVIRGEASVAESAAVDLTDAGPARGAPTVLSCVHDISDSLATKPTRDNSVQQRSPPKCQNPWGTQSRTGSRRSSRESREQKQARHAPSQSGDRPHSS